MQVAAIEADGLSVQYHGTAVIKGVSFSIPAGQKVALVGPNGAGKSTLLLALDGLVEFSGRVVIAGTEMNASSGQQLRKRIGFVFADSEDQLFMPTLLEDVAFGPLNLGVQPGDARRIAEETLALVGLEGMGSRSSHHLSDGERRRAAIATVLAMKPEVWLLDEPAVNLDPAARRQLVDIIRGLEGTVLVASHDLDLVVQTCERCLVLDDGELVADGPVGRVLADEGLMEGHGLEVPLRLSCGRKDSG
ncbi:MAG: ABC transporter ATP-binding protein [Deltaproteobacteria bacterium]|nr:MAG: ABC transporter ATP-binding protein [Deltaproteobacteria bacterium]